MATILTIDDDKGICNLIQEHFTNLGHNVLSANDGTAGLGIAEREPIDIILLDVQMPQMNGFAFLKKIRSLAYLDFIPIIMLTTITGDEFQIAGLKTGADDYITKPFSLDVVEARVENLLQRTQKTTEYKRDQYNLLEYMIQSNRKRGNYVFTKMLPGYENHPQGWKGFIPDLIINNGGKYESYFFESYQSLIKEETISKWKSVLDQYPHSETNILVRNKDSFRLAVDLKKIHCLQINIHYMKRRKA